MMATTPAQPQIEVPTALPNPPVAPQIPQGDSALWILMSPILFKLILEYLKGSHK